MIPCACDYSGRRPLSVLGFASSGQNANLCRPDRLECKERLCVCLSISTEALDYRFLTASGGGSGANAVSFEQKWYIIGIII